MTRDKISYVFGTVRVQSKDNLYYLHMMNMMEQWNEGGLKNHDMKEVRDKQEP